MADYGKLGIKHNSIIFITKSIWHTYIFIYMVGPNHSFLFYREQWWCIYTTTNALYFIQSTMVKSHIENLLNHMARCHSNWYTVNIQPVLFLPIQFKYMPPHNSVFYLSYSPGFWSLLFDVLACGIHSTLRAWRCGKLVYTYILLRFPFFPFRPNSIATAHTLSFFLEYFCSFSVMVGWVVRCLHGYIHTIFAPKEITKKKETEKTTTTKGATI